MDTCLLVSSQVLLENDQNWMQQINRILDSTTFRLFCGKNMDQEKQQRYSMLSDACIKIFNLDGSLQKSKLALDLELIINDI